MALASSSHLASVISHRVYQDQLTQEEKAELACEWVGLKYGSMGRNLCGEHGDVI